MIKLLGNLLRGIHRRRRRVILFLGAGASIESGAPSARAIIDRVLEQNLGRIPEDESEKYDQFYTILDRLGKEDRYDLLSEFFEKMQPSPGYGFLAQLIKDGYFEVIISTNYDTMLEQSLTSVTLSPNKDYHIFIAGHQKEQELKSFLKSDGTKLLKLHGDLGARILLWTSAEISDFPESIRKTLIEVTSETILFVGYSGRDADVLRILNQDGESVWWVNPRKLDYGEERDRPVLRFLLNRKSDKNTLDGDEARFDAFFRSLYECLKEEKIPSAPSVTWQALCAYGRKQASLYISEMRKEKFLPELYTARAEVQTIIRQFLDSERTGFILLGDSGVGKTNLLCHLAEELQQHSHLVLLYNCGGSLTLDIEREINKDLMVSPNQSILSTINHVSALATESNKKCVIMFDAVNEFRESDAMSKEILARIDSLVGRCDFPGIKILVSCRTTAWQELELAEATNLYWNKYFSRDQDQPFILQRFNSAEIETAYDKYALKFGLRSPFVALTERSRERIQDPLLLRMTSEVYQNATIPLDAPSIRVFAQYYEKKVRLREDHLFLDKLVSLLRNNQTDRLSVRALTSDTMLTTEIEKGERGSYYRLRDNGVLQEFVYGPFLETWTKFSYDRVFEYVLARLLWNEGTKTGFGALLVQWTEESIRYPSMWGATRTLLVMRHDISDFKHLASAADYRSRQIAIETLVSLNADDSSFVMHVLESLIKEDSAEAKRTALKTAYLIGNSGQSIFLLAARDGSETTRQVVADYVLLLWRRDPDFGFGFLQALIDSVSVSDPVHLPRLVDVVLEIWGRVWINFPNNKQIVKRLFELLQKGAIERLHLTTANIQSPIGQVFFQFVLGIARVFVPRTFEKTILGDFLPGQQLGGFDSGTQEAIRSVVLYVDLSEDNPETISHELHHLLESESVAATLLGAAVPVLHILRGQPNDLEFAQEIFNNASGKGRAAILAVLSQFWQVDHAQEHLAFVEKLTSRFISENRDYFFSPFGPGLSKVWDISLAAIGFAYCNVEGNQESAIPQITQIMRESIKSGDELLLEKCVSDLSTIGFYFPNQALKTLESIGISDSRIREQVIRTLATIKTLFPDEVDRFLIRHNADSEFTTSVNAQMDSSLVSRDINVLGMWNAQIYYIYTSPKFRSQFIKGFQDVANSKGGGDFAIPFLERIFKELSSNDFSLVATLLGYNYFDAIERDE